MLINKKTNKIMETKICSKCREEKPISEYYKDERRCTGYTIYCKKCSLIAAKEWREKNKEKVKQCNKEWRENNKEKAKQSHKEWYENNKEKEKQRNKEWRENNKEKAKQFNKEWYENNKEKVKQFNKEAIGDCYPSYITDKLKAQGFNKEQITPELIKEKRNIIKVKRIIKQIKNKQNYE